MSFGGKGPNTSNQSCRNAAFCRAVKRFPVPAIRILKSKSRADSTSPIRTSRSISRSSSNCPWWTIVGVPVNVAGENLLTSTPASIRVTGSTARPFERCQSASAWDLRTDPSAPLLRPASRKARQYSNHCKRPASERNTGGLRSTRSHGVPAVRKAL